MQDTSPVRYLIAGFVVGRNGECSVEVEVVPSRDIVEEAYPRPRNGKPIEDGERRLLGFHEFTFPSDRKAPPVAKLEYQARREFEKSLTW